MTKHFNSNLHETDKQVLEIIEREWNRQKNNLQLIASENFASKAVRQAINSCFTNKYAEGYIQHRYYQGCAHVDEIEELAITRLKKLFDVKFANVQPHSGSQANQAVLLALLNPGDTILGMSLNAGGHLTHGSTVNFSGKWFKSIAYDVDKQNYLIDMNKVRDLAKLHRPKLIIAGASAYTRVIDFAAFRAISEEVNAYFLADIAHYSGLIAAKVYPSPASHAHVITSTTHKTLRGPRGGIILTDDEDINKKINSAVFPGMQGGSAVNIIAAKAVAFAEALQPSFRTYALQVIKNAQALAKKLREDSQIKIVADGTDCHMMLGDVTPLSLTGKKAALYLEQAGLMCNKNSLPYDTHNPFITSGIRLGSAAETTRGLTEQEFTIIGELIIKVLLNIDSSQRETVITRTKQEVRELCKRYAFYESTQ